jgi:hypothetical protein
VTSHVSMPFRAASSFGRHLGRVALVLVVFLGISVLASCGTTADTLSLNPGAVGACYRGLPAARSALHDAAAKLTGVHRVPFDTLHKRFPAIAMPSGDDDTEVCTFAFTGQFKPGQVTGAPENSQGPVAVVVISSKKLVLVTSWVGAQLPKDLGRRVATS